MCVCVGDGLWTPSCCAKGIVFCLIMCHLIWADMVYKDYTETRLNSSFIFQAGGYVHSSPRMPNSKVRRSWTDAKVPLEWTSGDGNIEDYEKLSSKQWQFATDVPPNINGAVYPHHRPSEIASPSDYLGQQQQSASVAGIFLPLFPEPPPPPPPVRPAPPAPPEPPPEPPPIPPNWHPDDVEPEWPSTEEHSERPSLPYHGPSSLLNTVLFGWPSASSNTKPHSPETSASRSTSTTTPAMIYVATDGFKTPILHSALDKKVGKEFPGHHRDGNAMEHYPIHPTKSHMMIGTECTTRQLMHLGPGQKPDSWDDTNRDYELMMPDEFLSDRIHPINPTPSFDDAPGIEFAGAAGTDQLDYEDYETIADEIHIDSLGVVPPTPDFDTLIFTVPHILINPSFSFPYPPTGLPDVGDVMPPSDIITAALPDENHPQFDHVLSSTHGENNDQDIILTPQLLQSSFHYADGNDLDNRNLHSPLDTEGQLLILTKFNDIGIMSSPDSLIADRMPSTDVLYDAFLTPSELFPEPNTVLYFDQQSSSHDILHRTGKGFQSANELGSEIMAAGADISPTTPHYNLSSQIKSSTTTTTTTTTTKTTTKTSNGQDDDDDEDEDEDEAENMNTMAFPPMPFPPPLWTDSALMIEEPSSPAPGARKESEFLQPKDAVPVATTLHESQIQPEMSSFPCYDCSVYNAMPPMLPFPFPMPTPGFANPSYFEETTMAFESESFIRPGFFPFYTFSYHPEVSSKHKLAPTATHNVPSSSAAVSASSDIPAGSSNDKPQVSGVNTPANEDESNINIGWLPTEPNVLPTRGPYDDQRYWIRTVIEIIPKDAPENLTTTLEYRLENIFDLAFRRQGPYLWRRLNRKKRDIQDFPNHGPVRVKMLNTIGNDKLKHMDLIYTVAYEGILVPAKLAVDALSTVTKQEFMDMLGYRLVRGPEEYLNRGENEVETIASGPTWLSYVLSGCVAGLLLICILCLVIYYRCCQKKDDVKTKRKSSDNTSVRETAHAESYGEQNRQQIFTQQLSHRGIENNQSSEFTKTESSVPITESSDPYYAKKQRPLPAIPTKEAHTSQDVKKPSKKPHRKIQEKRSTRGAKGAGRTNSLNGFSQEKLISSETQTEAAFDNEAFSDEDEIDVPLNRKSFHKTVYTRDYPDREPRSPSIISEHIQQHEDQTPEAGGGVKSLRKGGVFDNRRRSSPSPPSPSSIQDIDTSQTNFRQHRFYPVEIRSHKQVCTASASKSTQTPQYSEMSSRKVNFTFSGAAGSTNGRDSSSSSSDPDYSETDKQLLQIREKIGELLDDAFIMARPRRWYNSVRAKEATPKMLKRQPSSISSPLRRTQSATSRIDTLKSSEKRPLDNEFLVHLKARPYSSPTTDDFVQASTASTSTLNADAVLPSKREDNPSVPKPKVVWSESSQMAQEEKSNVFSQLFLSSGTSSLIPPAFRRPSSTLSAPTSSYSQEYLSPLSRFANYRPFAALSARPFSLSLHSHPIPLKMWKPSSSAPSTSSNRLFTTRKMLGTVPSTSLPVLDMLQDANQRMQLEEQERYPSPVQTTEHSSNSSSEVNLLPENLTMRDSDSDEIDAVNKLKIREPAKSVIEAIKQELQKFNNSMPSSNTESSA